MGDYEKEMRRFQDLWKEVQSEDEEVIESDGESEIDNVSINSDYPDVEQEANNEDVQGNLTEVAGVTTNAHENDVTENESEIVQDREKYYLGKNGTKWREKYYNKNVRTRGENLITQSPGVKRSARDKEVLLNVFLFSSMKK
ncbi:hypothetical protein NQ318_000670 [Aromia moschata]|uniref:Uncharacterized protein n=1 Tax=Aromia moschata TaxID=1265417 RepID=A0AAV8XXN9_9CUCU|nr:hypothetical protein NQ318_000670 [Aromia moschata]